jgi:hypothetical protein
MDVTPTAGKPGVLATLDAGAATTPALYFMYDVKQFDASEWSAPPLEGRLGDRPGVGKIMIGRGATNSKGPQVACLAAPRAFKAAGRMLPARTARFDRMSICSMRSHDRLAAETPRVSPDPSHKCVANVTAQVYKRRTQT